MNPILKRMLIDRNLHNKLLDKVMNGTIRFFNVTPVGRILNRFSKGMDRQSLLWDVNGLARGLDADLQMSRPLTHPSTRVCGRSLSMLPRCLAPSQW